MRDGSCPATAAAISAASGGSFSIVLEDAQQHRHGLQCRFPSDAHALGDVVHAFGESAGCLCQRGQRHRQTCEFSGLQVRGLDAIVGVRDAGSGSGREFAEASATFGDGRVVGCRPPASLRQQGGMADYVGLCGDG